MRQLIRSGVLLLSLSCTVAAAATPQKQEQDATFTEEIAKAEAALAKSAYQDALKAYKRANSRHDGKSPDALYGMARSHFGLGAHAKAVDTCNDALKYVGDDRELEALARNLRANALLQLSVKPDDERLTRAEADLRTALQLAPLAADARYNLGFLLLRTKRDQEGVAILREFLERSPSAASAAEARRLIENPRRAREPFAPDFSIVTIDGQRLSLESLRGKTVLLDFWGTWCPPCRTAIPDLVRLARKYAEREFVMVGISSDHKESVVRDFVQKNRILWPQFVDLEHQVQRAFNVSVFPTYMLIDEEGIIRSQRSGHSAQIVMWLNSAIERSLNERERDK